MLDAREGPFSCTHIERATRGEAKESTKMAVHSVNLIKRKVSTHVQTNMKRGVAAGTTKMPEGGLLIEATRAA